MFVMLPSHISALFYRASTLFLSIKNSTRNSFHSNCNKSVAYRIALKNDRKTRSYLRKFILTLYYTFAIIFTLWMLLLHEFQIYKNTTWENVNIGQEISVQLETNEGSKKIDSYWENWRQSVIYQGRFQGIPTFALKKKEDA